jgi:hypothetical protein
MVEFDHDKVYLSQCIQYVLDIIAYCCILVCVGSVYAVGMLTTYVERVRSAHASLVDMIARWEVGSMNSAWSMLLSLTLMVITGAALEATGIIPFKRSWSFSTFMTRYLVCISVAVPVVLVFLANLFWLLEDHGVLASR